MAVLLVVMNRADMIPSAALLMALVAIAIYGMAATRLASLRRKHDAIVSGLDPLD